MGECSESAKVAVMRPHQSRSAWQITVAVWRALFLREALVRLFATRMAWVWLLLEPLGNMLWLIMIFSVIRVHHIGGIATPLWIMIGMLVFFTFRRTVTQVQNSLGANEALFAYRQVTAIDVALVRAGVEGVLMLVLSVLMFTVGAIFDVVNWPEAPWNVLEAFFIAWACATGLGLVFCASIKLVPETERIINFVMMPIMMVSGVLFPLSMVSPQYREWLMLNPVAHAIEAARLGFAPYYHSVPELDLTYACFAALLLLFTGLALFRRFAIRLVMQ
jgi:capsular polysaccharide transport system permease protein